MVVTVKKSVSFLQDGLDVTAAWLLRAPGFYFTGKVGELQLNIPERKRKFHLE